MESKKESNLLPIVSGVIVIILLVFGIAYVATKKQTKTVIPTPPPPPPPAPSVTPSQPSTPSQPPEDTVAAIQSDLNGITLLDIDLQFEEIDVDLNSL
jgi:hypothetical protein